MASTFGLDAYHWREATLMKTKSILIAATLMAVPFGRGAQAFVCANGTPMPIPECCPERKAAAKAVVGALGDACGGGVNNEAVKKAVDGKAGGDSGMGQLAQALGSLGQAAGGMGKGGGAGQEPSAQDPSYPSAMDTGAPSQTPAAPTPTNQWCPGTATWATSCPPPTAPIQQVGAVTSLNPNTASANPAAPALAPLPAPWSANAASTQAPDGSNAQAPSGLSRAFIKRPPIRVLRSRNP